MNRKAGSRSFPELVLIVLLALVPVVFSRLTQECFEVPQSALLITGALALLGAALLGEAGRAARAGWGAYPGAAFTRLTAWARRDLLGAAILLYVASAAVSTVVSPNPAQSLHGANDSSAGLAVACATASVYFAARLVSRGDVRALERFARAAGVAAALAAGYALLQLAGLDPLVWGRTASYEGDVRIFGTLGHPNMLGAYLLMTVPLTVWLVRRARGGAGRTLWALIATASVIVIAATLSRGAWIGLGAAGIAAAALAWRGGAKPAARGAGAGPRIPVALLVSAGAALAALLIFARTPMGPHLVERVRQIASLSAPTTRSRFEIWQAAWRMFQDHPLWGVGLDAFGTFFPRYRSTAYWNIEWGHTPNKAHNEGLQILATQGIAGGIAAVLVLALALAAVLRAARRAEGPARGGVVAAGAALAGFVAQDLASFTVVSIGSLAAALLGWLASSAEGSSTGGRRAAAPAAARVLVGAALVALFFALVALPLAAQVAEKNALREEQGSPGRAEALARAAGFAPWEARYPNLLASSLLVQAAAEPDPARGRGTLRRAVAAEERAIAIEPENPYCFATLGRIAAAQASLRPPDADVERVRRAFDEALRRDPNNAEIMDQKSNAMIQLGQTAAARAAALDAARLYPGLGQPLAFLGYMALLERRPAAAADTLELSLRGQWWGEETAREAALSNLSAAYLSLGRFEDARRAAEEALSLDPRDKDAQGNRDLAIQRLGGAR